MLKRKDLLGIQELSCDEISYILDNAKNMKMILKSNNKKTPHLQGKSVITLFYENSTRTRLSFEMASKFMGASSANISVATSSVQKGETLIDTGKNVDSMATDLIIIRHSMSGAPHLLAKNVNAAVINAGDGMNEHPTQALLDMYTIREIKGGFKGLKVAIVGDITHSRVARSNIWGLTKMGAQVSIAGPSTLVPKEFEKLNISVFNNIEEAVENADVVMALRLQLERQKSGLFPTAREYAKYFGVDQKRLSLAKKDAILLHPGPVNRGYELPTNIVDCDQSLILEQVTNGVAVRMALLYLLTRKDGVA